MPRCVCAAGGIACYKTDGDLKKLKGNTAYLGKMIDSNIEGYRAIKNAGHEILPDADKDFEGAAYRKTCLRFFKLMSALNRDLKQFFDENGAEYPVWLELEKEAGRYLK